MTGTIKKIIKQKGFGFITPDDGTEDVFFHRGSLAPRAQIEDLNEGDSVQFQVRKGDKGPVALDVKIRYVRALRCKHGWPFTIPFAP